MAVMRYLRRLKTALGRLADPPRPAERELLALGRLLAETARAKGRIATLREVEFKIFSQWGDDGIIQWLVHHLAIPERRFVEFGVEDYRESNTRFLMINDNWSGLVMDGSPANVASIRGAEYFWRHQLQATAAFIDAENINSLLSGAGMTGEIGILHIDVDGNDYWIWRAIKVVAPVVAIVEYNAVFGNERAITVPYDKTFQRTRAHYSNLYYGASLPALHHLAADKGYAFIGCNSAGNNAYFVRSDSLNDTVRETTLVDGYVPSLFRESRDRDGRLNYLTGEDACNAIRGMPVYDVTSGRIEPL